MPDNPKAALKLAILQSVTTEAGGFYSLIVTVASTFLGGSLLFLEKIAPHPTKWTICLLVIGWAALIAAIGCVARVRYHNLKSARLALNEDFDGASGIDRHTDQLSRFSQLLLITGMSCLFFVGILNINRDPSNERNDAMPKANKSTGTPAETFKDSIPYGSLGPGNTQQNQSQKGQGSPPPQPTNPDSDSKK